MSSSWWSKKLGTDQPATPPPATRPPDPVRLPPVPQHNSQTVQNVQVTGENFASTSSMWQGGDATRTETSNCPNCGSDLYFSRTNAAMITQSGSASPTPRCYACGFAPGREMQGAPPS